MQLELVESFEGVGGELVDEAAIEEAFCGCVGFAGCLVAHA
jgi:hypothetical protein